MKNRKILQNIFLTASIFLISACTNTNLEAYHTVLQKGLDTLAVENYAKAEAYFEVALEEKPEDEKATAYLKQTQFYQAALTAYENNDLETAQSNLEQVASIKDGSESLVTKAKELEEQIRQVKEQFANYQKNYVEIENLLAEEKIEEALAEVVAILDSNEIKQSYFAEMKGKLEEMQKTLETKQAELVASAESQARAEGPDDKEILPNIREGGETFSYLRNTSNEEERTHQWKREIEELYGVPIEQISNQKIADYLLEHYNQKQQFDDMIANGNQSERERMLQEFGNPIAAFDALPLPLQALLAATIVDDRATSPALRGYYLHYEVDGDYFIVNISSGAGSGHPWYS